MTGVVYDYPTRILVHSESDSKDAYLVELSDFRVGEVFNGSCQCKHFVCDLRPRLRSPDNKNIYRCKHIQFARTMCLDFLIEKLKENDPNIPDEHQT